MRDQERIRRFEECMLPHLDAAYNLARWLTRNDLDAEDVVQESYLRALKFFESFHSTDSRPWLLAIVRNTFLTMKRQQCAHEGEAPFDEALHTPAPEEQNPEAMLLHRVERQILKESIEHLPLEFREVIVLRELEGLSYREIATITAVPLGTVMSRLARARKRLQDMLVQQRNEES